MRYPSPLGDPISAHNISPLHPKLKDLAWQHINVAWQLHGVYIRVTQGLRTWEEQDALYALGRTQAGNKVTNAKGGQSWHNFGLAYDIAILNKDGTCNWKLSEYPTMELSGAWRIAVVDACPAGIECGANWRTFEDYPHFDYHKDLDLKAARELYKDGGINRVWTAIS